jgi:hypothetical protein
MPGRSLLSGLSKRARSATLRPPSSTIGEIADHRGGEALVAEGVDAEQHLLPDREARQHHFRRAQVDLERIQAHQLDQVLAGST